MDGWMAILRYGCICYRKLKGHALGSGRVEDPMRLCRGIRGVGLYVLGEYEGGGGLGQVRGVEFLEWIKF